MRVGPLPRLRRRARLLGARRDHPRAVRDRRHRRLRAGLAQAPARGSSRWSPTTTPTSRPSASRRRSPARSASSCPARSRRTRGSTPRTRSRCATASSPRCARWSRRPARQKPAGDRDRGHPLGRRGNARPDRVPGPLGARAAAPGRAWRATSCSTAALDGAAGGATRPRSRSSRWTQNETASWSPPCFPAGRTGRTATPSWCRRSPSAPAATPCSPRRWSTGSARRARTTSRRCRRPSTPCSRPGSTRSRAGRAPVLQHASVVGQTFWEGSLLVGSPTRARSSTETPRLRSRRRTWWCRPRAAAWPASTSTPSSTC